MIEPYSPQWFAFYFVLGLLLGQFAIRNWRWAALCGLASALAAAYIQNHLGPSLAIHMVLVVISFPLLLGISGLSSLSARVGAAILTVPFISLALGVMGALFVFAQGGFLSAVT